MRESLERVWEMVSGIVCAIFLKGAGLSDLWSQYLALLVMGSVILWFASTRFRKRIG